MSNAQVSSSPLDFVGVDSSPAPGPAFGEPPGATTEQVPAVPHSRSGLRSLAERALYAALGAGLAIMIYGLSRFLHF
ncbi:MAG: hypothetical protein U1A78_14185 [Polyangia bacterium]